jgi:hypothetical protein
VACLETGFEDAMAVVAPQEKYRKRLQERLNEEIRRRERVIRIFPNDDSALRLIGALLAEQNEVWQERRYPDMGEFAQWIAERLHFYPSVIARYLWSVSCYSKQLVQVVRRRVTAPIKPKPASSMA